MDLKYLLAQVLLFGECEHFEAGEELLKGKINNVNGFLPAGRTP